MTTPKKVQDESNASCERQPRSFSKEKSRKPTDRSPRLRQPGSRLVVESPDERLMKSTRARTYLRKRRDGSRWRMTAHVSHEVRSLYRGYAITFHELNYAQRPRPSHQYYFVSVLFSKLPREAMARRCANQLPT